MAEKDLREPVEPRHVAFARALVAVARHHGIRDLKAEFYGGAMGQPWTRVSAHWNAGRDGEERAITLSAEVIRCCPEIASDTEASHA